MYRIQNCERNEPSLSLTSCMHDILAFNSGSCVQLAASFVLQPKAQIQLKTKFKVMTHIAYIDVFSSLFSSTYLLFLFLPLACRLRVKQSRKANIFNEKIQHPVIANYSISTLDTIVFAGVRVYIWVKIFILTGNVKRHEFK